MLSFAAEYALIITVVCAAAMDVASRRIPNALTVSALVVALLLRGLMGFEALITGIGGAAMALAVVLPLFALRGIGGGDAKLLIAVGMFLGFKPFFVALAGTAVVGGVMSMWSVARSGVVLPALYNTGGLVKWVFSFGRSGERVTVDADGSLSVPYGVAIAAGTLAAIFLGGGVS